MADRWYEGLFLFDSSLATKEPEETEAFLKGLLEKHGATIKSLEKWDDRRLAYEIGPMRRGTYFLTVFQMDPTKTNVFRRDCNLSEKVVRHLLIQDDKMMALLEERVVIAKKREAEALQAQSEGLRPRRERPRR